MPQKACGIVICNCGNSLYDHREARGALATHSSLLRGGLVGGGGERGGGVVGMGQEPRECNLSEISRGRRKKRQEPWQRKNPQAWGERKASGVQGRGELRGGGWGQGSRR